MAKASRRWLVACGVVGAVFGSATVAQAADSTGKAETGGAHSASDDPIAAAWHNSNEGYTPPPSSEVRPDASSHVDAPARHGGPHDRAYALELNPAGIGFVGHYSAQLEWLPLPRHAVVINPSFDFKSLDDKFGLVSVSTSFTGGGAEVGYHYYVYTPHKDALEPSGLWIGPSVSAQYTSVSTSAASKGVGTLGGSIDAGAQFVIEPGIVLGLGIGMQYKVTLGDYAHVGNSDLPLFMWHGLCPRFLSVIGYAF